jgi:3-oxoadipate enol-lactonase
MIIAVNGFDMNYEIQGPEGAPWVTFANSLVTSLEMWNEQARALAGRYRVLRYDMRGHGRSDAPKAPYSIAQLAMDAHALWDSLGVDRSHWIGLSLGGMIGVHLAANHPQRFRTFVGTDFRPDANEAYQGVFVERIRVTREQGMAGIVDPTLQRFFTSQFAAANPETIEKFRQMIRTTAVEGHIGCCEAIKGLSEGKNLSRLTMPTLFMGGEYDVGAPPDIMRAMTAVVPGARYVMIEGAGHISNIEKPDRFLAEIESFLAMH